MASLKSSVVYGILSITGKLFVQGKEVVPMYVYDVNGTRLN